MKMHMGEIVIVSKGDPNITWEVSQIKKTGKTSVVTF